MVLPQDFINRTKDLMGDDLWATMSNALEQDSTVSIRLNRRKWSTKEIDVNNCDGKVAWCEDGFYLSDRPPFTFDPLMHAGCYYVQEASSMFLYHVLKEFIPERPLTALDMCAAPGGKSSILAGLLPEESLLVCNEPNKARANILAENMQKFGRPDVIVTCNYPKEIRQSGLTFDIIITDVPCSGEGMFRKDTQAKDEWSLQNVQKCATLQREIVEEAWQCLNPGGTLIYSTCTFNAEENECNVYQLSEKFGAEIMSVGINDEWNITGALTSDINIPAYRFIPGKTRGEGLFMAVLKKDSDAPSLTKDRNGRKEKQNKQKKEKTAGETRPDKSWICKPDIYTAVNRSNTFYAIPNTWLSSYEKACRSLNILTAGIPLGEIKGKDIVPAQGLALSCELNRDIFPTVELEYAQAIEYLRKEAIRLPHDIPTGYILLTFRNIPLGFCKNIGNRANNLYPAEWKIRSSHTPDKYESILK
ncbi:MAG: hypothetical protein ACI4V5_06085 [Prevotella sp.]